MTKLSSLESQPLLTPPARFGLGTGLGLASAVGYTAANICLRNVTHIDPLWVTCIKAVPTVVLVSPWIIRQIVRHKALFRSKRDLAVILLVSILAQVGGNVTFQWSLGVIGLALAVPFALGTILLGSTAFGHWLLGEVITKRTIAALLLVAASVCILTLGADDAHKSMLAERSPSQIDHSQVGLGVFVVCVAGFCYSVLGAMLRWAQQRGTPMPSILFVSGMTGVVVLGLLCLVRPGLDSMLQTSRHDMHMMLAAGIFNAVAFSALVSAMHLSGLVYINALNASQTAMAAAAGVLLFGEALSWPLIVGVPLTGIGLLLIKSTRGND